MRKTKIICTLGPATNTYDVLKEMVNAGMNVVRFNMAHGNYDDCQKTMDIVKKVRDELKVPLAIMIDIKGPEVRTGQVDNPIMVKKGDKIIFTGENIKAHDNIVPINYSDIANDVFVGGHILLNDGILDCEINKIENGLIYCEVKNNGTIGNHKNMHFPGVHINLPFIREKDINDMNFAIKNDVEYIACSFVSRESEVAQVREYLDNNNGSSISLIAKIENKEGIDNLDEIMNFVDGVMVARGDLGVEIPIEKIPTIQKNMIKKVHLAGKRVITATEMLESMTHNPRPTRAEVSDVANAVYDGTSCVMLSGETSVGDYPIEVVKTMARICKDTEANIDYKANFKNINFSITNIADALSHSSVNAAFDLNAASIVVCTKTGKTAMMVSRFRPSMPIIGLVTDTKAYHQLAMSWDVFPYLMDEYYSTEELSIRAIDKAKTMSYVKKNDILIVVAGIARQIDGTNLMRIEKVR